MLKFALGAAVAVALAAGPAAAQPAVPAAVATPTFSADTPIEVLEANPAAKAVVDKDLPHLRAHPEYDSFKSMSIRELQPLSEGAITDALVAKLDADLKLLGPARAAAAP